MFLNYPSHTQTDPIGQFVDILYLLIPVSVVIVLAIGAIFWWAIASGQFDELDSGADSVVEDDESRS